MTNEEMIHSAVSSINPKKVNDRVFADVGAILVTESGNSYSGVSIDTSSGTGFCAETSAIAAMVTAGEYRIDRIVAVWKDDSGELYVLPPCGRCRLFIQQIDQNNIETNVILGNNKSQQLKELLPLAEWPEPLSNEG